MIKVSSGCHLEKYKKKKKVSNYKEMTDDMNEDKND
tara:strand:- start:116 stop:223 length:108 start_codon:yes stop_codon:yes gene_type:complete